MREQASKKRSPEQRGRQRAGAEAQAPRGISEAAVRGAMQSRHEADQIRADERQVQQDDDQEWRRAGGKSPE